MRWHGDATRRDSDPLDWEVEMSNFKFDKNAMKKLDKEIQKKIEKRVAPEVKRRQVDPLREDLNRLAVGASSMDRSELRRKVLNAYARHNLTPGTDLEAIVDGLHRGEQLPDIEVRVDRPRLT